MESIVTTQNGLVTLIIGKITIALNGITQPISSGTQLPKGATLFIEDGAQIEMLYGDGSTYSNSDVLDEIETLQASIASGEDPTLELPDTAAGQVNGNQGGSDIVSITRSGNETIANAGYNTNGAQQAEFSLKITNRGSLANNTSRLTNDTNTVNEDTLAIGNVLVNDSDIDSDLNVVNFGINNVIVSAGTTVQIEGGSLIINADGSYILTPDDNWSGSVPIITYTTNTGASATLTIEVTPIDDPSVLLNDTNTINEDTVANGNVLGNDTDLDNNLTVLSFEIEGANYDAGTEVTLDAGALVINQDGDYTFTPKAHWHGALPVITYTTNTGASATLTIDVTPIDDPSVLLNDTNTINEDTVATGNVLGNDIDIDNDLTLLSFNVNGIRYDAGTAVTLDAGVLIINQDGHYTFTPKAHWNGVLPVITYTTNTGASATLTLDVTPIDDDFADNNETVGVLEDSINNTGNIIDGSGVDGPLSVVSFVIFGESGPFVLGQAINLAGVGQFTLFNDGDYSFTPVANFNGRVPQITYTLTDGSGNNNSSTLTLDVTPVNDDFTDENEIIALNEDTTATGNIILDSNSSSVDGPLTVQSFEIEGESGPFILGQVIDITGVGSLILSADGEYSFTPEANYNGSVPQVTYVLTDGTSESNRSSVSIHIDAKADAPKLTTSSGNIHHINKIENKQLPDNVNPQDQFFGINIDAVHTGRYVYLSESVDNNYITVSDVNNTSQLQGGSGNDILVGGNISNSLLGGKGHDILTANGLNDALFGGDGIDTAIYSGHFSDYTITNHNDHQATPYLLINDHRNIDPNSVNTNDLNAGDHLYEVERIVFADGVYTVSPDGSLTQVKIIEIPLDINVELIDTDGSETLSVVTIEGLPNGLYLTAGILNSATGAWTVSVDNLTNIKLQVSEDYTGDTELRLTLSANTTESSNKDTATTQTTLDISLVGYDYNNSTSGVKWTP